MGIGLAGGFWGRAGEDRQVTPRQGHRNTGRQSVLQPRGEVKTVVKPGPVHRWHFLQSKGDLGTKWE